MLLCLSKDLLYNELFEFMLYNERHLNGKRCVCIIHQTICIRQFSFVRLPCMSLLSSVVIFGKEALLLGSRALDRLHCICTKSDSPAFGNMPF